MIDIVGMERLERAILKIGGVAAKDARGAALKGMRPALQKAIAAAPRKTGALRRGMKLKGERAREKGKKVYAAVFDRKLNDAFQTVDAKGRVVGYYPVSQEHGFLHANSGKDVPGRRFVSDAFNGDGAAERAMLDEMARRTEAAIAAGGLSP